MRIGSGVQHAEGRADAAHEAHVRMAGGKGLHIGESLPERGGVEHQLPGVQQPLPSDIETVDHYVAHAQVVDELKRLRYAGGVDGGNHQYGVRALGEHFSYVFQRAGGLGPRALEPGEVLMHGGVRTEYGNLDCAYAEADEVGDGVRREESAVGEDVHAGSAEAGCQCKVVHIAHQHGLAAGEGNRAHSCLGQEFLERLAGGGWRRRGNGGAAVPPIIITEPATLVAGFRKFEDYVAYRGTGHQKISSSTLPTGASFWVPSAI